MYWNIIRKMVFYVVGAIIAVYLLIVGYVYVTQHRMLYFPTSVIETTPEAIGLAFEDVTLTTTDGINLHGWFVPAETPRATIIFCHGNGGNISHRLESLDTFNRLGLSVFIFDYRGYGQSDGIISEEGTYRDAEAAWGYLTETRHIPTEDIVIFGRSLGGGIATWLARRHEPAAVIIESSFTSISDIGAMHYPFLPIRWISRFRYNSLDNIKHIHAPALIIHSPDDNLAPFKLGRRLYEAANEPKTFLEISGDHNDGFIVSGRVYDDGLDEFLTKHLRR